MSLLERSLAGEAELSRRLNRVFEDHDVLLTPATAAPPPRIGQLQGRGALWTLNAVVGWVPYNGVWNVTGQPAASVPAGFGADGLPRGVQIVGRPATRRRCCRSPVSWKPSASGPSSARQSPRERRARAQRHRRARSGRAAGDRRRCGEERRGAAARARQPRRRAQHRQQEHAHGPRQRGRSRLRARDPRAAGRPAARRRLHRGGGRSRRGYERPQLGRRPARRHHQLPVRDPAVVRERRRS